MTEPASAPQPAPTQAELRAERLAEEEAHRPSLRLGVAAAGVWLALFFLMAVVLPDVALRIGGAAGRLLVPTLPLDLSSVVACALFVCALATARAPGGPGVAARDFVLLALGLGLLTGVTTAIEVAAAGAFAAPATGLVPLATGLLVLITILACICGLGAVGLALLWLGVAHEVALLPRGERREEVARVAHLSAPAVAAAFLWSWRYARLFGSSPLLMIAPHVAVALTLSGVAVVLAAWLRLRRPPAYGRGPAE